MLAFLPYEAFFSLDAIVRTIGRIPFTFEGSPLRITSSLGVAIFPDHATSAEDLVAHAEKRLGCRLGESTPDGRVFLKREEECVAACCGAPVVVVNGHYHENVDAAQVDELLDGLK